MERIEFKNIFDAIAKVNGFEKTFGGWFKESSECIAVLDLQKSNFGDYYELNIKIFVQGAFGNKHVRSKDLVKKHIGDVFIRQSNDYKDTLDFNISMDDKKREEKLKKLFSEYILPITNKALSRFGLKELAKQEKIFLLPAVKEELI